MKKKILIIGGDSLLGNYLYEKLNKINFVVKTSKRNNYNSVYFDLNMDDYSFFLKNNFDYVFYLIANSDIYDCENNEKAKIVNVIKTKKLLKILLDYNEKIIFPSTNLVLDCKKKNQDVDTNPNPLCKYAEHKLEIENFLENKNSCVLRLSKIVDLKIDFFSKILYSIKKNQHIDLFKNYYFSPVSLNYCYIFFENIIKKNLKGRWHICSSEQLSYYDFGLKLSSYLDLSYKNIFPILKTNGIFPRYPKLVCRKSIKQLKFFPQTLTQVLKDFTDE